VIPASDDEIVAAIKRIGLSPDGELLYLWLQKHLHLVVRTTEPGALQQENGRRILAHDLMLLLSAGIDEAHAGSRSDRIIVFKQPSSATIGERDSYIARRRARLGIDAYPEPEPGNSGVPGPGDAA
jgi:hypothetical protein